ncbi:hypothetical protein ACFE04_007105 [Oxalis oulophora]
MIPSHKAPNLKYLSTLISNNLQQFLNAKNTPDINIIVSALKSSATNLSISHGQQLHSLIFKSGLLQHNTLVLNGLINVYAKCGFVGEANTLFQTCPYLDPASYNIMISGFVKHGILSDAVKLFDEMPNKDCISYTTMIMGFVKNQCWLEAIQLFKDMRRDRVGVVPNDVTLTNVLSACARLGGFWNSLMIHGLIIKMNFDGDVLVSTNLLRAYCVGSSLEDGMRLFAEMRQKNVVTWNVMLNGYAKAGLVHSARDLFEKFPEKDVVSWGTMIDGYIRVECLSEALKMYGDMIRDGFSPSDVLTVDLVSACGRSMAFAQGQQLHSVIIKYGFDCYDFIQASLIHFYAACGWIDLACLQFEAGLKNYLASQNALLAGFIRNGMIERAREIFNEMPERDVFSWSTMISGEKPNVAIELFHEMIACGTQPNEITMVSVFSAIASLGLLKEGLWAHAYVQNNSIPLSENLSAAVIDMYAKCGSIDTALELFSQIKDKALKISPWNAIICGLAVHGDANLSLEIFSDLERRKIKPNSITLVGVLSACCHGGLLDLDTGRWENVVSVRREMCNNGVEQLPGYSGIV